MANDSIKVTISENIRASTNISENVVASVSLFVTSDINGYIDTLYHSGEASGTQEVYIAAYDIKAIHIASNAVISADVYQDNVKYASGAGKNITIPVKQGINKIVITGTYSYITMWGR